MIEDEPRRKTSGPQPKVEEVGAPSWDQAERAAKAIRLLDEWLADESGYDEQAWPIVKQAIEDNRLSYRKRFDG